MTQDKQEDIDAVDAITAKYMAYDFVKMTHKPGGLERYQKYRDEAKAAIQRYTEQRVAKAVSDQTDWLSVNHERAVIDARIAEQRQTQSNLPHCGGNNCMSCLYQKEWGDNHLTELEAQRQSLEDKGDNDETHQKAK